MSNPEKIALLTDSTADLPAPMREGKPIYVVPLKIRCEDGEYSDGVDITAEGVYERLHRGELPRTSLPEGGVVSDTLDQIRADGYERVIAVMLSSGLSGTYNMVRLQAGQRDDLEIAVFDSRSGSLGIGIMVLQLWEEIVAGASWETLVRERAPHLVANTFPFFSVDTLEYLRRGGRLSNLQASIGTVTRLKPVITLREGKVVVAGKGFGTAAAVKQAMKFIAEAPADPAYPAFSVYSDDQRSEEQLLPKLAEAGLLPENLLHGSLGATIGTHVGPGAMGLIYIAQ